MMRRSLFLSAVVLAGLGAPAGAQHVPTKTVLVVRPAEEPSPALRYGLLPPANEVITGNAALFYHRAIEYLLHDSYRRQIRALKTSRSVPSGSADDPITDWLATPAPRLPLDVVHRFVAEQGRIVHEVELGALRDHCDWEFLRRDEGYDLSIEEIQEARRLGRLVALRARLGIAEGRIDEALHWLQVGFALARHVGEGRFYIQSMVAVAIAQHMIDALEQLVQAPGCPNLYWALAGLPRPFIDLTAVNEGERSLLEREFPSLRDVERSVWSIEEARVFSDELERKGALLFDRWGPPRSKLTRPSLAELAEHLVVVGTVARAYPEARRALIASGEPAERVDAMPTVQVVAAFSYRIYMQERDEIFKWMNLSYWEASRGMAAAEKRTYGEPPIGIPFIAVLPSVRSILAALVRIDRRLAALRNVEAVRWYAATHDGAPPPSLEALIEAPPALDPATGGLFPYKAGRAGFTLSAPPLSGFGTVPRLSVDYEVDLKR